MSDLDKKLDELSIWVEANRDVAPQTWEAKIWPEVKQRIKQAFKDAGGMLPDENGNYHISNAKFVGLNNRIEGHMTGQEWYDRFEKGIDTDEHLDKPSMPSDPLSKAIEIRELVLLSAKKAAGIE